MLINFRNAMMASKRLPYDAELEYLESTGTQYIDTGIALSNASLADITWVVEVTNFNDGCMGVFGASPFACMYVNFYSNGFYMRNMRGSGGKNVGVSGFNIIRFSGGTSYLNGTAVETDIPINTNPTRSMLLFAYDRNNVVSNFCKARVSSFLVKVGGVLIADFIPVRVGTVGYMYDRVTRRLFGNAGTGDFVLGPDVVPVEYIESHGTEYIDTGVVSVSTSRVVADIKFESVNASSFSGVWGPNSRFQFGILSGVFSLGIGSVGQNTISADTLRHIFVLDANTKTASIDSNQYSLSSAIISFEQKSIPIFVQLNAQNNEFAYYCSAKLYAYQLFDAGVLARDFIPVRVGTDATSWAGAMMDVLTRRIYRNAGTGAFTYGSDLRYPIPAE